MCVHTCMHIYIYYNYTYIYIYIQSLHPITKTTPNGKHGDLFLLRCILY